MLLVRIIANSIIFLSIFLLPWWVATVFLLVAVFYFNTYYEVLLWAVLLDGLYVSPEHLFGVTFLLYASVVFLVSFPIKRRLKFY